MRTPEFLTPIITALDEHGEIDDAANRAALDHVIEGGVDGVLLMGSTGEFYGLRPDQKRHLAQLAAEHVAGRTKLLVGTGMNSTEETIQLSNDVAAIGVDGVVVVSPYYFVLDPADLAHHFDQVLGAVDAPVYLYNFPARTGNDITPAMLAGLAHRHENLAGIKDTVPEMGHTRALIEHLDRDDVAIYSGFDENFAHNVLAGGSGCIAGLSNVYPELCAAWVRAAKVSDLDAIARIQRIIDLLSELYDIAPMFVPVVKKAMQLRGVAVQDHCRGPVTPIDDERTGRVAALLEHVDQLIATAPLP